MNLETTITVAVVVGVVILVTLIVSRVLARRVGEQLRSLILQLVPVIILTAVVVGLLVILDPDQAQVLLDVTITAIPRVLIAVLVIIIARSLGKILGLFAETALRRISPVVAARVNMAVSYLLLGIGIIIALDQLGVSTDIILLLVAGLVFGGALATALAVGLGSAPLARQVVAGRYVQDRFAPGQKVKIGDLEGRIVAIGLSSCVLEGGSGENHEVPHRAFVDGPVTILPD